MRYIALALALAAGSALAQTADDPQRKIADLQARIVELEIEAFDLRQDLELMELLARNVMGRLKGFTSCRDAAGPSARRDCLDEAFRANE